METETKRGLVTGEPNAGERRSRKTLARRGRPPLMRSRKLTSYSLDARHRRALRDHMRRRGLKSAAAALREIIEEWAAART